MKKDISHIFESSDHIDESRLWLYAKDKLHRDEAYEVEKHLIDCEMCSDIVEGFSKFGSEGSFNASRNRAIEMFHRSGKRQKKIIIRRVSIAATFVLIAVSSIFLVSQLKQTKQTPENLAFDQSVEEEIIQLENPNLDDKLENTVNVDAEKLPEPTTGQTKRENEQIKKELEEPVIEELNVVDDDFESDGIYIDANIAYDDDIEIANQDKVDEVDSDTIEMYMEVSENAEPENEVIAENIQQEETTPTTIDESTVETLSTSKFNWGKNRNSTSESTTREASVAPATNSFFAEGMSAYYDKNYAQAISILRNISKNQTDYWDARWTIADCLVQLKNIEQAKAEYRNLQDSLSPYRYAAGEKLLELE